MRVDDLILGIIVCSAVLVVGALVMDDQFGTDGYNVNITNKEFETAEKWFNDTNSGVNRMKDALQPGGVESASAVDFLIAAGSSAITIAWTTLVLPYSIIFEFVSVFKLPPIVGTILTTMISISILFGLIYLFFRFKPQRD